MNDAEKTTETPNYVHQARADLQERLPGISGALADLYTLLALVKGQDTTLEDVHDAWSVWKDRIRADHHSLIPFKDLAPAVQELDGKYRDAIAQTAALYSVKAHQPDELEEQERTQNDVQGDYVSVSATELEELRETQRKMNALEAVGVDNWEGYDTAREIFHGGC